MLTSISLKLVFLLLALVFFALAFFGLPRYRWEWGGVFFLVLAWAS